QHQQASPPEPTSLLIPPSATSMTDQQRPIGPSRPTLPVSTTIRPRNHDYFFVIAAQPTYVCGFDSAVRPAFPSPYRAPVCATDPRGSQLINFFGRADQARFSAVKRAGGIPSAIIGSSRASSTPGVRSQTYAIRYYYLSHYQT